MLETVIATIVAVGIIALLAIVLIKSSGELKGGGSMNTTILGAQDLLMTKDQKRAAEVIVEQNSGKKFEEDDRGEIIDKNHIDWGSSGNDLSELKSDNGV